MFAVHGVPHLPRPVTGVVFLEDRTHQRNQLLITCSPGRLGAGLMGVVGRHGNLCVGVFQRTDDRLDSVVVLELVDELDDKAYLRSSSAAKKAEAFFRISFTR